MLHKRPPFGISIPRLLSLSPFSPLFPFRGAKSSNLRVRIPYLMRWTP